MAISAAGLLANIHASLDGYLSNTLVSAEGMSVHNHGVARFVPPSNAAWVVARYDFLTAGRQHYRQGGSANFVTEIVGMMDLTIAQQTLDFESSYTLASARDQVAAHFPEGGVVPVFDFAVSGQPQVGSIFLDGWNETLLDDGRATGMIQHQVRVQCRWLEPYTR